MADQRFSRTAGRAEPPMTAVALLVSVPGTDQKFGKIKSLFPTAGAPARKPLSAGNAKWQAGKRLLCPGQRADAPWSAPGTQVARRCDGSYFLSIAMQTGAG